VSVRRGQVNEIPAQEWKRVLCGKPNASKDQVRTRVEKLGFLKLGAGQDACDAAGVCWAARHENQKAIRAANGARA
jgi:Holliday junction resolvasome RuvABC endonuclease subunit